METVDPVDVRMTSWGRAMTAALGALALGLGAAPFPRLASAQPQLQTEGRVEPYRVQDVASFNLSVRSAHQSADGGWTATPLGVVSRYLGDVSSETRSAIVEVVRPSAEAHDRILVMVTREGLLDDSVRGTKDRLELVRDPAGFWSIAAALRAWAYQPSRGRAEYHSEPSR